jgi:hypothetical protein
MGFAKRSAKTGGNLFVAAPRPHRSTQASVGARPMSARVLMFGRTARTSEPRIPQWKEPPRDVVVPTFTIDNGVRFAAYDLAGVCKLEATVSADVPLTEGARIMDWMLATVRSWSGPKALE